MDYFDKLYQKIEEIRGSGSVVEELSLYSQRYNFVRNYSWAFPSQDAVNEIVSFVGKNNSLLECGAGNGLWASLIQKEGIHVVATDQKPCYKFYSVEGIDSVAAIKKYNDINTLMLCWPSYDDPMGFNTLSTFTGNKLIYIGEGDGGCTGDDKFHDLLREEWKEVKEIDIRQWIGIHDAMFFFERK